MKTNQSSRLTINAVKEFNRRTLLKGAAVAGGVAATMPFIIRDSLASSGEVNVFAWGDYIQPNIIKAFEAKPALNSTCLHMVQMKKFRVSSALRVARVLI